MIAGLVALLGALAFGLSSLFIRQAQLRGAVRGSELLVVAAVNVAVSAPLFAAQYLSAPAMPEITWLGVGVFALAGLLSTFGGRQLMFAAMRHVGPSRAGSLKSLAPLFTALLAVPLLGEPYPLIKALGTGIAVGGLWLLSRELLGGRTAGASEGRSGAGLALGIAAAVAWGFGYVLRKLGLLEVPLPLLGVLIASVVALVGALIHAGVRGQRSLSLRYFGGGSALRALLVASLLATAGQICVFLALHLTAATSAVVLLVSMDPLFTLAASRLLLGDNERLNRLAVFAVALTTVGGALVFAAPGM